MDPMHMMLASIIPDRATSCCALVVPGLPHSFDQFPDSRISFAVLNAFPTTLGRQQGQS